MAHAGCDVRAMQWLEQALRESKRHLLDLILVAERSHLAEDVRSFHGPRKVPAVQPVWHVALAVRDPIEPAQLPPMLDDPPEPRAVGTKEDGDLPRLMHGAVVVVV